MTAEFALKRNFRKIIKLLALTELFKMRQISKSIKKVADKYIKKYPSLHFKLRCAKNSTLFHENTTLAVVKSMGRDAKRIFSEVASMEHINCDNCQFSWVVYNFNEYDHILNFEKHMFNMHFPKFGFIKLKASITITEEGTRMLDLTNASNNSNLLNFLHSHPKTTNMSINNNYDDYNFQLEYCKRFLDIRSWDDFGDKLNCTLFWWYRKFTKMPKNLTKLRYLKIDNKRLEIIEIINCHIENDFFYEGDVIKFNRNQWSENGFNEIPLFIDE